MRYRLYDPRYVERLGQHVPLHSDAMKLLLGLPPKAKLPAHGMPECYIQGVKIWVRSLEQVQIGKRFGDQSFHRVMAQCPHCGESMSAGRLNQHKCKPKDPLWILTWSPEGKEIARVHAPTYAKAVRKAPKPYRKYLGEISAVQTVEAC